MSSNDLHILLLEDRETDSELVVRELRRASLPAFTSERVMTEAAFRNALRNPALGLILADYSLPGYDGLSALALARRERPEVPFIFVSGSIGEDLAISALHQGATDYVLKQRLSRLAPAVQRALREVEERRHSEEEETKRAAAEERHRLLTDQLPEGVLVIDPHTTRILDFNDAAPAQLGYSREEFARLSIPDFEVIETPEETRARCARVLQSGREDFDTRHRTKDGAIRDVHVTAQLVNVRGQQVYQCVFRDITASKQAEESLRQSSIHVRHLNEVLHAIRDINRLLTREKNLGKLLRGVCTSLIKTRGFQTVWIGQTVPGTKKVRLVAHAGARVESLKYASITWDDSATGQGPAGTAMRERRPVVFDDISTDPRFQPWRNPAAGSTPASIAAFPLLARGRLVGVLTVRADHRHGFDAEEVELLKSLAADVARGIKSIKDEQALEESERRFRLIAQTIHEVFWMAPADLSRMEYVSPAYEYIWGRTVTSLYKNPASFLDAIHPEDRARVLADYTAKDKGLPFEHSYRIVRPDGSIRWILDRGFPAHSRGGGRRVTHYIGVAQDITERRQLEDQFLQAQKMEAVGRLAGGVAHDFNNILQAIVGVADVLLMTTPATDPRHGDMEEIHKAARRAANLTRQLLAFSRRQRIAPSVFDLNTAVGNMGKMLARLMGEDIRVVSGLSATPCNVNADIGQIEQVIMNLAVNARDAMPAGGRLTISTARVVLDARTAAAMPDARPGTFVRLSVSDTGTGIDKEIAEHIFEPFFTTKDPGKGSGLGLAVIYGIAQQHHGWVSVASEPGQGSTFSFYLPAHEQEESATAATVPAAAPPRGRGEHVLLIEDDPAACHYALRILHDAGYDVQPAGSMQAALAIFADHPGRFDLVFSDVVLPDGNGVALAGQLLRQNPALAVLLCSGYTEERIPDNKIEGKTVALLEKPYAADAMLVAVRRALDARKDAAAG